jgi:hypothetical protein
LLLYTDMLKLLRGTTVKCTTSLLLLFYIRHMSN